MSFLAMVNPVPALRKWFHSLHTGRQQAWLPAAERITASRTLAVLLILAFFTALSAHVVHIGSRHIDASHEDERFTLGEGLEHLNPFGTPNERFEVGETTRWFVRLLHPVGLFYVNSYKGVGREEEGALPRLHKESVIDEWKEGGRVRTDRYSFLVADNPVVQDYAFAMRTAFGMLAAVSFCLVLWVLFTRVNLAAAAVYGALVLGADIVLSQFSLFYTETTLFILFNLAVFLCFQRDMPYRKVAYAGILAAAALSAKLSGVFIAAPLFAYAAFNMRGRVKLRIELFLLCFAASMLLININAVSLRDFVSDTLWNVLHYKLGDNRVAAAGGMDFFQRILQDIGWFIIPLFLIALLQLVKSPRARLAPAYVLGAGIVYLVWSLTDTAFYFTRNLASAYVFMSFIIALAAGDLAGNALARRPALRAGASLGALLIFLGAAASLANAMQPLRDVFYEKTAKRAQACDSIGAVGLAEADLRALRQTAAGAVTAYPGIRPPYQTYKQPLPGWLAWHFLRGQEPGRPPLVEWFEGLQRHDCLVAYRQGHTKRLTNFLALRDYRLRGRVGNRFFFVEKPGG